MNNDGIRLTITRVHAVSAGQYDVVAQAENGDFYLFVGVVDPPREQSDILLASDWKVDPQLSARVRKLTFDK